MVGTQAERRATLDAMYPHWECKTLWKHFETCAKKFPDETYIIFDDVTFSYRESLVQINKVTRALYRLGVRPGDHVGILFVNSPEYVWLIYALSKLGAVKVSINTEVGKTELSFLLTKSRVTYLFSQFYIGHDILAGCTSLKKVVVGGTNKLYTPERFLYWSQFMEQGDGDVDAEELETITEACQDPHAVSDIMFTSGSTSMPKGVCLTHDMLLRSAYAVAYTRCFEVHRRTFAPVPLFHIFNYVEGILALSFVGGAVIMCRQKFNPSYALQMLKSFEANELIILGSMLIKLLSMNPHPEDFPKLHAIYTSVCTPDWLWGAARKAFGLSDIITGFGMTELSSAGVMTDPEMPDDYLMKYHGFPKRAGCAGLPEYGGNLIELQIRDPVTGKPLPRETSGEICYRGATVTKGYFDAEDINGSAFSDDGWFLSGDIGIIHENGFLTFEGRMNDTYKINGENVSPHYLDTIIGQAKEVVAVQVVGVTSPNVGEIGVAFIEATDPSEETKEKIQAYCKKNLARFQIPKYFIFSDSGTWPHTCSGKLSKKLLREYAEQLLNTGHLPGPMET